MTTLSDHERAETEMLLRQRLDRLAAHAPTAVRLPDEIDVVATRRPTRRHHRAGVIAAVTALVGAGGFTTYSFLGASSEGGAATPEEAVTTFVAAVNHEDLLGAIDVTAPEEVGALRGAIDSITADGKRVGLLGDSFDAGNVGGLDVAIDDLTLDTNFYEGGLAAVTATGGTVKVSLDTAKFPFGDKVRALLPAARTYGSRSSGLADSTDPALVMTVERGGRWYVSLEYTIAEYIRRSANWDLPGAVSRTSVGFDSPDAAVSAFYDRLAGFDLQGALDTFAPGEDAMAWLAESWMTDAQAALARGRANGWNVAISGLTYETIGSGDHLTLKPATFKIEGAVPGQYLQDATGTSTTEPQPFTIERSTDGCTTYRGSGATAMFGSTVSSPLATPVGGGVQVCGDTSSLGGIGLLLLSNGVTELPSISVVRAGGQWYVSPLGTALASTATSLHDAQASASLFDSPLAPFIYGGFNRAVLEASVQGQSIDAIDAACLPALTVDNSVVTGVVADPPADAVRACADTVAVGGEVSSSGSGSAPAPVVKTITAASVPASTVP